jgi:hypothetical protein
MAGTALLVVAGLLALVDSGSPALAVGAVSPAAAAVSSVTAPDYTANVTATSTTQAQISFQPTTTSQYVDVHYTVNGATQQNFRMTNSAGTWTQVVNNLSTGSVIEYWFTYEKNGPQYDTPHSTYTQGSSGGGTTGGGGGPVPGTIPLQITNNSGRSGPVYIYDLGTQLSSGTQGWADGSGTFHAWPDGGNPPTPAPDASIVGPANGQTATIRIPKFSGRVYFSYGQKLVFALATGGLVQPAVQNPSDPNRNILFNWSEYTLNDSGIWINSTQVDMFSAPYAVSVQSGTGATQTTGHLKAGGYNGFYNTLRGAGWGGLIQTAPDGSVLRALAPSHGAEVGALSSTVMNDYINRVWQKYSSSTLTVTPFGGQPNLKYYGRVSGNVMNFTNSSGAVVTSFQKPDSDSIFGCYKLLDAPNDLVRGPISRTLCAGYNRTTLLSNPNQPDSSDAGFYNDPVTNQFARDVHSQMVDGKAYAFAFDDVGNHESLVHDGSPQQASLILDPFN